MDDLIDVIEGNRKYMKCVYVYNKIDVIGIDDVDKLARQPSSVVISCNLKVGFAVLIYSTLIGIQILVLIWNPSHFLSFLPANSDVEWFSAFSSFKACFCSLIVHYKQNIFYHSSNVHPNISCKVYFLFLSFL